MEGEQGLAAVEGEQGLAAMALPMAGAVEVATRYSAVFAAGLAAAGRAQCQAVAKASALGQAVELGRRFGREGEMAAVGVAAGRVTVVAVAAAPAVVVRATGRGRASARRASPSRSTRHTRTSQHAALYRIQSGSGGASDR